ncbi:hypothetical protein TTHERM_000344368 (macronuclear) [Tetrahymena thermophila SB210]|uniref:Uncharacterized protein n=1 Tax=Tetrahymena thermophila (strain SB210) TaxID=312017 RepID=W7X3E4_TETTS|nr:hypothetical protein TTHERM_000344368 [Tetrahymena thermophila SB210]EWS73795.1 hypothetical protein TTHERM_000344368 [Tetrahymena thermophila SB210]|eukprot:XP_012653675.1 hypothetical protein TTHERM_000344368 [Tetrahymena thermophila SB210]
MQNQRFFHISAIQFLLTSKKMIFKKRKLKKNMNPPNNNSFNNKRGFTQYIQRKRSFSAQGQVSIQIIFHKIINKNKDVIGKLKNKVGLNYYNSLYFNSLKVLY